MKRWRPHPGFKYKSEWLPDMRTLVDNDPVEIGDYNFVLRGNSGSYQEGISACMSPTVSYYCPETMF